MRWIALLVVLLPGIVLAETLSGYVIGITDGDTLTLLVDRTQHKIRLAEIDTPERGQPWGTRARQALADKALKSGPRSPLTRTTPTKPPSMALQSAC